MVSRRTARMIGEAYAERFADIGRTIKYLDGSRPTFGLLDQDLYDFLFDRSYPDWLVDHLQGADSALDVKNLIMHLHVGKGVREVPSYFGGEARVQRGQQLLLILATDILNVGLNSLQARDIARINPKLVALLRSLELDGYLFRNGRLLTPESEVLDAEQEAGLLETLYTSLGLAKKEVVLNHLSLAEEHYQNGKWGDCISNARSFLEGVLQEVAMAHSLRVRKQPLGKSKYESASEVRDYLEAVGLVDTEERKALASVYGTLSDKGSHPYMAEKDQARLLRQLALVLAQFGLLRLDGLLQSSAVVGTASAAKS